MESPMPKSTRRKLSRNQVLGFQRRARKAIQRAYRTQYAFCKRTGFPKPTLTGWLSEKHPRMPFMAQLLNFADKTGVYLDHLLLDEGPEIRGAPAPSRTTAALLHEHIVAVLVRLANHPPATVRAAFPDPDELLERVTTFCQGELEREAAISREAMGRL